MARRGDVGGIRRAATAGRKGRALEIELIEKSAERLDFNVVRCRYAEMYRALGLADLGSSLSCQRDFALVQGFNPEIQLTRTQTIMDGAPFCDFRFRAPSRPPQDPSAGPVAQPKLTPLDAQVVWTFCRF